MRVRWMMGDTVRSDALIIATGACVWCDVWCRGGGCDGVSCAAMCSVVIKGVAGRQGASVEDETEAARWLSRVLEWRVFGELRDAEVCDRVGACA